MNTNDQISPQKPTDSMTHQQALDAAKAMGIDMLDAQLLLLHALGRSVHDRAWLLAHNTDSLFPDIQDQYIALLQRRAIGVPVAYLTGIKEFYGLPFTVDKRVLIPRPETETLIDWARELIPTQDSAQRAPFKLLDLGTGSGILAITIKHLFPFISITATDQSEQALDVASLNAADLLPKKESILFLQGGWFTPVKTETFNLIISNPPYILENDEHLTALTHEPLDALVSGVDGLKDLRHIIEHAPAHIIPGGWLLLEHGYNQSEQVQELLHQTGFSKIQTRPDLAGISRVTGACWETQNRSL